VGRGTTAANRARKSSVSSIKYQYQVKDVTTRAAVRRGWGCSARHWLDFM